MLSPFQEPAAGEDRRRRFLDARGPRCSLVRVGEVNSDPLCRPGVSVLGRAPGNTVTGCQFG